MADKHTSGPLHVFSVYAQHEVRTPTDTLVAVVMNRADARLFSAAPEMLDALRNVIKQFSLSEPAIFSQRDAVNTARAAVAKATRNTP